MHVTSRTISYTLANLSDRIFRLYSPSIPHTQVLHFQVVLSFWMEMTYIMMTQQSAKGNYYTTKTVFAYLHRCYEILILGFPFNLRINQKYPFAL